MTVNVCLCESGVLEEACREGPGDIQSLDTLSSQVEPVGVCRMPVAASCQMESTRATATVPSQSIEAEFAVAVCGHHLGSRLCWMQLLAPLLIQ